MYMYHVWKLAALSFVTLCLMSFAVFAQSPSQQQDQNKPSKQKKSTQQPSQQQPFDDTSPQDQGKRTKQTQNERIHGEVIGIEQVWVSGGPTACLVTLKDEQGELVLVDLGPARAARQLALQLGDELTAKGQFQRIQNFHVFMASQASSGDNSFTVTRSQTTGQRQNQGGVANRQGHPLSNKSHEITGTVQSTRKVNLRSGKGQNLVAKVKTNEGRTVIVDLGPVADVQNLNLKKGDQITVQGRDLSLQNGTVLIAFRVEADGETVSINRRDQIFSNDASH